jgi:hypothetical protein
VSDTQPEVHIFWDNSNIFHSAQQVADQREGMLARRGLRLQFDQLFELARASRHVASAFCVGSVPPELDVVWKRLRTIGIEVELFERGAQSRREQAVDQALQVRMLRAGYLPEPAVAVLLTGDGAGFDEGTGFGADLARLRQRGWGVEVLSWEHSCSRKLRSWAESEGEFIPLDDYYESITFTEGLRRVKPLALTRRRKALPLVP